MHIVRVSCVYLLRIRGSTLGSRGPAHGYVTVVLLKPQNMSSQSLEDLLPTASPTLKMRLEMYFDLCYSAFRLEIKS